MAAWKQNTDPITVENWTGHILTLYNGLVWPPDGKIECNLHRTGVANSFLKIPISTAIRHVELPVYRENILLAVNNDVPINRDDLVYPISRNNEVVEFVTINDMKD